MNFYLFLFIAGISFLNSYYTSGKSRNDIKKKFPRKHGGLKSSYTDTILNGFKQTNGLLSHRGGICNPPCQNGGNCLPFDVCQCPQEFNGPQCQYTEHSDPVEPEGDFSYDSIETENIFGGNGDTNVVLENKPHPGSCFTWGGSHFKTFDGEVFSFTSSCAHTLVRDAVDNTFSVIVQNSQECLSDPQNCYTIVKIYLQDKEYALKHSDEGVPIFTTGNRILPVPGPAPGIRTETSGNHIIILLDAIGAKIKWDGLQLVQVEVKESLWNKTSGLCGKIDGDSTNDMLTKDDNMPKSVVTLATSWQVDSLGEECKDIPKDKHVCQDTKINNSRGHKAREFCKTLLSDKRFALCQKVMDVRILMDACIWDYCSCKYPNPKECACETLNVYVRECAHKGITALVNWRDDHICPIQCTGGKAYMPCGPIGGQALCGGASEKFDEDAECEEGCYCPQGTFLHNSRCITKKDCPCMYRGKDYPPGSSVPKECNTCTCSDGKWVCTQARCGTRCSVVGDPHYITFDGKRYNFMGKCTYSLVEHDNFTIEVENVPCGGAISQAMSFSDNVPSCPKTLIVKIAGQNIKVKQGREVTVNGQEVTKIPFHVSGAIIRVASSMFLIVELPNGAEVWWDGVTRVHVDVPPTFMGQTKGLCGTFNKNQKDDFITPEGDIEQSVIPFANKWKTTDKCGDISEKLYSHPCDVNIQNKVAAEEHCNIIRSKLFADCNVDVDPEPFYQDCLYDLCSCDTKLIKCLCPMIAAYAEECARKGIKIEWRNDVRECGMHCPGGQKYQICGNSCTRSCYDIAILQGCKQQCVEGCNCPEGETLDEHGECIPIGQCNCQHDGLDFPTGYREVRTVGKEAELCTCINAQWNCRPATQDEIIEYPKATDIKTMCNATENKEFTTCEPAEPMTCKNMHSPELVSTAVCRAGCQCKPGYVLDGSSKTCVKPTECPCHHGGRSYSENSTVQSDCNICMCKRGKWQCTDYLCPGECSTWGDSHYKTFDGKLYDYQGQCDYILVKGTQGNENSFDISVQNVPCGSLGVSCSKSLTIRVGAPPNQESITLTREKKIPEHATLKQLIVRQKGHFVIVEAPELRFLVHWDKGTRVYVKLDISWKNKVKGLCGNYNDNQLDDFQTPYGGISEVSPQLFGDSWRLQPYCPKALDITNTCEQRPDRKVWALKQCGILKSSVFARCHSEVPVEIYLDHCIFDTCACDQGGDCECLCTALAAYAQECNNKGIPIKWRTPELCPMQCDERCAHYSPCISTCPTETCDNTLVQGQLKTMCKQDTCIEGCQVKLCPPNFVYLNSSMLECVPRSVCKPLCLEIGGVEYFEGDIIEEDSCHTCYCSRGKKNCQGQPCTMTPEPVSPQLYEEVKCEPGWTEWINQDEQSINKSVNQGKLSDIEPLPQPLIMNNLKGTSRCEIPNITDIQCRTVKSHLPPKETGLDVECSLEHGLICNSNKNEGSCADFEIRVKCECAPSTKLPTEAPSLEVCGVAKPSQEHLFDCHLFYKCESGENGPELMEKTCGPEMMYNPIKFECDFPDAVIKIKPYCLPTTTERVFTPVTKVTCRPNEEFRDCSIVCHRLCMYYSHQVKLNGHCLRGKDCEQGCVSSKKLLSCPPGMFWANNRACVAKKDCMCVSHDGKPVKPGNTVKESDCEICQCIDNYYTCDKSACLTTSVLPQGVTFTPRVYEEEHTTGVFVILSTVTPPEECNEEDFINLIDGDVALADDAFTASSTSNRAFVPKFARLSSEVTGESGGSWVPQISDKDQYLQINLGRQEPVYGVIIKGSPLRDEYVTSYKVLYTSDGHTFSYITDHKKRPKIFRGSFDGNTPSKQMFDVPVEAQIIRIMPETWHNAIAVRVEVIGCRQFIATTETTTSEAIVTQATTTASTTITTPTPYCTDPMGLDNAMMADQQISASSELKPQHTKNQLKISEKNAWQPITNSPSEWVQFDFLEPRNITGLVTQGGPDGWVTAFNVKYSHNGKDWNPMLGDEGNERTFLGNVDGNTPHVINFDLPVQTKLLKVIPTKWHQNIQLKIEPHGCFEPYPPVKATTTETSPTECNNCPEVGVDFESAVCRCKEDLWWDGEKCVARTQCPCVVGHILYAVETAFEKEDCSQCTCKLGGVSHCTPKVCEKCEKELRSVVTSTCGCICQPCDDGARLCPTSNICINTTDWCNGVKDCPDDETDCVVIAGTTTTPKSIKILKPKAKCPTPSCSFGYVAMLKNATELEQSESLNTMFTTYLKKSASGTKTTYRKEGRKGGHKQKPTLAHEKTVKENRCSVFECVPVKLPAFIPASTREPCPEIVCPPGYTIEELDMQSKKEIESCPRYECKPPPPVDAVCNITGRTFNTFDLTEYKYDICNHILARDLENDQWEILLKKNCTTTCSHNLIIHHEDHTFILYPDLSIEYDGFKYTVEQTKKIGSHSHFFAISRLGEALVFVSNEYGFWVIWDQQANAKIGITRKLLEKVDGLCGYFNDNPKDDKRKPDGTSAKTTAEFGDSWAQSGEPVICEAKACPLHIQNKAWEMCNLVKEQTFAPCAKVLDLDAFVSRCLETTCTCLEAVVDDKEAEEKCRCLALQDFVVDCLTTNSDLEVIDWRMKYDCPVACESPLVHHDCYRRRCEPSCGALGDSNACPKLTHVCFPGCYCPPGYVRKDENCILPTSCGDCECNVLPHLEYVTYDERNFTINGNCVYVMSRDILDKKNKEHKFQVLITNHPCEDKKDKMCVGKVTILYKGHKSHITRDLSHGKLKLIADSEKVSDFKEIQAWTQVKEDPVKHLRVLLTEIQVLVSVYYPSLGVSIKAPSLKYGSKLEGLCGDCDGDMDDDLRMPEGAITSDIDEFGLSWLYEEIPGDQSKEQCANHPEEQCEEVPSEFDPCIQLEDSTKYGQCHPVLSPSLFIDWCKKDTCNTNPKYACSAIEAYSHECGHLGFCIDWHTKLCPAKECPADQEFKPCAPVCSQTCEALKEKEKKCTNAPVEGCFCSEGKVFLNDTCVAEERCEACDDEGHRSGDTWQRDPCTKCMCEGTSLQCETQNCPSVETICEQGFTVKKVPTENECCDKYLCVHVPIINATCEPPLELKCSMGQVMKLIKKADGCQQFVCECKPIEDCEPVNTTSTSLKPGFVKEVDATGCCPVVVEKCKKEFCPKPPSCLQFHSLEKLPVSAGECCPEYNCLRPNNKCIVDLEYIADEKGGERPRDEFEKQQVLKESNEKWQDGPCRECKCIVTSAGDYNDVCTVAECPLLTKSMDHQDYVLEPEPVVDQCCPNIKKVACKHDGKTYKVGEKWSVEGDPCTTFECLENSLGLQKVTQVAACDTKCELGWEYISALPETNQCCGSCKPVACVADGIVYKTEEKWTSPDHCTNYFCSSINGSVQIQSVMVNCPELSEEIINDYVVEIIAEEGKCCKSQKIVACKVGTKIYKVGETWPSLDGDKCKKITCAQNKLGEIIKQESMETCYRNCSMGWEYKESNVKCCGECVQVACVVDNELKKPGENWTSSDGCTTYFCDLLGDQFTVISHQESCPNIDNCSPENIYTAGCCKHCNITTGAQVTCGIEEMKALETVGLIMIVRPPHGKCVNKESLKGFTECIGACRSFTSFNPTSGQHESVCSCCQVTQYKAFITELECEDGYSFKKQIAIPSKCGCEDCVSEQQYTAPKIEKRRAKLA